MIHTVQKNVSLKPYNTFGVDAYAQSFIAINDDKTLLDLYEQGAFSQPFFVLGSGSNVLFTKDYTGLILHMNSKGIVHFVEGSSIYITAQAGEIWNDFVWYCVNHNFPGVENMALIPGTVGASPVQNIGAYGTELMDVFYSCTAFDTLSGDFVNFRNEDCQFTYRDSIFKSLYKGRYIICSVTYKLRIQQPINSSYGAIESELQRRQILHPTIKDIATVVSSIRVEKLPDPTTVGNAGSFFKNPIIDHSQFESLHQQYPAMVHFPLADGRIKLAAGWLIESCGWKGKQDGPVAVWKHQALVLTNNQHATGIQIFDTSSKIMNDVANKFGITLEREVNIL